MKGANIRPLPFAANRRPTTVVCRPLLSFVFGVFLGAQAIGAPQSGTPWSVATRVENDLPANSDRYYTNGVSLSFTRCASDRDVLWPQVLRLPGLQGAGTLAAGFDFGQVMVTPADTSLTRPDPNDRPYAGLLFIGVSWQRFTADHYAALKLISGLVGPPSLAEQTQKTVHRTFGVAQPRGWDFQLHTEPILNVVYERRQRHFAWGDSTGWSGDTLFVQGAMVGNVLTQAYAQVQVRGGWRTPQDFGTSLIRGIGALPPARDSASWGAHAFAGAGALAVARNLSLDGNTFRSSPSVERRPFVPAGEAGGVIRGHGWQLTASWIVWGREFETQLRHSEFASVALAIFR
jgi:lipid A 3-O-deacylase